MQTSESLESLGAGWIICYMLAAIDARVQDVRSWIDPISFGRTTQSYSFDYATSDFTVRQSPFYGPTSRRLRATRL